MPTIFSNSKISQSFVNISKMLKLNMAIPYLPDSMKYGSEFNNTYRMLKKTQFKSKEWLNKYQNYKLKELVHLAYNKTKYYHRLFKRLDLHPNDIQSSSDLVKLPLLSKSELANNIRDFIVEGVSHHTLEHITTGGSTGTPTNLYWDRIKTNEREWAFIRCLWDRIGYTERAKSVVLRGAHLDKDLHPDQYDFYWSKRSLILSSFYLDNVTLPKYIQLINHFRPAYYQAFPSSIGILSRYIEKKRIEMPKAKAVILTSEKPNPYDVRLAQKVFHCRVFTFYGQTERVVLAGECEISNKYHVFPEYGVTEIISQDNTQIHSPNEPGSIVGTGFVNDVIPLIRFDTGDVSSWLDHECTCGRCYPLIDMIEGRRSDMFIISESGRAVSASSLNPHEGFLQKVKMFQFEQSSLGKIVLYIVPYDSFRKKDEVEIEKYYTDRLGEGFSIQIQFVDNIIPIESGKRSVLRQSLNVENYV